MGRKGQSPGIGRGLLTAALVLVLVAGPAWAAVGDQRAAMTPSAGPYLTSGGSSRAMFPLAELVPGHPVRACHTILESGGARSTETRLFASVSGPLARYLVLTVMTIPALGGTRGRCVSLTQHSARARVLFRGSLARFPRDYGHGLLVGIGEPPGSHTDLFIVSIADDPGAEGLMASVSFVWEARE